jgi:hypothetical protein
VAPGGDDPDAAGKCNDWVAVLCARSAACVVQDLASCKDALARVLVCAKTRTVSARYDECLDDTGKADCKVLFKDGQRHLPEACTNVFLQPRQ